MKNNLDQIIAKFLLNKSDQEELDQLHEWKKEAEENAKALQEMQALYSLDMQGYHSYDQDAAWQNVEQKLSVKQIQQEDAQVMRLKGYMMAAAAIVTLIAATVWLWQGPTVESYPMHYATQTEVLNTTLQDESKVTLAPASTLDLTSEDFVNNRNLNLKGRAFFEVAHDKAHPFSISMLQGKVTVLGTAFDLHTREGIEEILVTEGKVKYEIDSRSFILKAGDYIKVVDGDVIRVENRNPDYLNWKRDKITLDNVSISQGLQQIADHFDVEATLSPEVSNSKCKISITVDHNTIEEALEEIALTMQLIFEVNNNKLSVSQISC